MDLDGTAHADCATRPVPNEVTYMLRNLKFTSRLHLLLGMFVLGFAMYGTFAIGMFEKYRIGGQLDQQFALMGHLRSDIQPSPTYIVESYLLCQQIDAAAEEDRPPLIKILRIYEQQYLAQRAYWQTSRLVPNIKTALLGDLDTQAVSYYKTAFDELLPALASRNDIARLAALRQMAGQFDRHRQAIGTVVAETIKENNALYASSMEQLHRVKLLLYGTLLGFLVVLMAFARQIRGSIVQPLAKAVALARRVASGDLTEKILHRHDDEMGQLLHALNDMSENLRARLAERDRSSEARRRALTLLERLIETANIIVVALDRTGTITIFNAMAEAVSGHARVDVIGKKWTETTVMAHPEPWQLGLGIAGHAVPSSSQQQMRCKSGELRTIDWKNSALDPSTAFSIAMISFGNDITEQLLMEKTLRHAKLVAESANRSKSAFLANMSHEIRTPMNAVLGMTALAMRTNLTAQQRNYLNKSQSAAKGLLGIIDDILDYSKIEAGKLHFESRCFSVADVLAYISALLSFKAQEKGLAFEISVDDDVPLFLIGDEIRLRQVLLNLLSNAIKFTAEGRVSLCISQDAVVKPRIGLRFTVDDSGIGIDDRQLATLFDAFEQADSSTTRHHGGTGLGLTISRSLVQMMHGVIWAERRSPRGSRFVFTALFGEAPDVRDEPLAVRDFRALRALIIADDMALDTLTGVLNNFHIDVTQLSSGVACLARLEIAKQHGKAFHFLVLDWDMPALNGSEIVHQIRSAPNIAETAIIALVSGHTQGVLSVPSIGAHIDGVLQHPVDAKQMLRVMSTALDPARTKVAQDPVQVDHDTIVAAIRGARILLVEDNEINQELALEVLKSVGLKVELACNGVQAVAMVASRPYDAVMMDWQMPVMDGLQATRKIRSDPQFKYLPIIAMTANAMAGDRDKCLAAGMNDHITKPIDIDELLLTLMRWVPLKTRMRG